MTRWKTTVVAAVMLLWAVPVALAADKVPDLKGSWTGKSFSIVAGSGGHWPTSKGT